MNEYEFLMITLLSYFLCSVSLAYTAKVNANARVSPFRCHTSNIPRTTVDEQLQPNMNNYRCHSRFLSFNNIESYFTCTALTTHILITLFKQVLFPTPEQHYQPLSGQLYLDILLRYTKLDIQNENVLHSLSQ